MKYQTKFVLCVLLGVLAIIGTQPLFAQTCTGGNCVDGEGAMTYPDGGTYVGEFKQGKFDGKGTRVSSGGTKYVGQFKE